MEIKKELIYKTWKPYYENIQIKRKGKFNYDGKCFNERN
jgi:hypothetical protein